MQQPGNFLCEFSFPFIQIDENVKREIINHRLLRHPNIIRFKEVKFPSEVIFTLFTKETATVQSFPLLTNLLRLS